MKKILILACLLFSLILSSSAGAVTGGSYLIAPGAWSCPLTGVAASLTQCQAAPASGLSLYVTDIIVDTTTATAGTWQLRYGTGTNCATGTTNLYPGFVGAWTAPVLGTPETIIFITPLKVAAANALCVFGTATNTINIQVGGFTAP